ncbi:MAG: hypothetical protein AAB316_02135 [Bacteroidota bacterium]
MKKQSFLPQSILLRLRAAELQFGRISAAAKLEFGNTVAMLRLRAAELQFGRFSAAAKLEFGNTVALLLLLAIFSQSALAQQTLPFSKMKKNAIVVDLISPISADKEINLGYERMLNASSALEWNFGFKFKNNDPGFEPYAKTELTNSYFHECHSEITWFLFIPVAGESNCMGMPDVTEKSRQELHLRSHVFGSFSYKWMVLPLFKSKIASGFYLQPGLTAGRRTWANYAFEQKTWTEIETVETEGNSWGIPFVFGSTDGDYVQKIDSYHAASLEKQELSDLYLRPQLAVGVQLPLGNTFSFDLRGQFSVAKKIDAKAPVNEFGLMSEDVLDFSPTVRFRVSF